MKVLLVEDDASVRAALSQSLDLADIPNIACSNFIIAKDHITGDFPGVILSDMAMPGKDGFAVLAHAKETDPDLPVIFLTGHADVPMALRAMQEGAFDFLEKPCETARLVQALRRALAFRHLTLETRRLSTALRDRDIAAARFPGKSDVIQRFQDQLRRAAEVPVALHFWGPEGVGKRMAATVVHELSGAAGELQFVPAEGLATRQDLVNPEDDTALCILRLETADQADRQALLRRFETGRRVMACSNLPLDGFDPPLPHDLLYALNVMSLSVPTLAARREDLRDIFVAAVADAALAAGKDMPALSEALLAEVMAREWPDNLPELRQMAQRVAYGLEAETATAGQRGLHDRMEAFERQVISAAMAQHGGRVSRVAEDLELPRKTLYDKLQRHGLRPEAFRAAR